MVGLIDRPPWQGVRATTPAEALQVAKAAFSEQRPVVNVWAVRSADVLHSEDDDRDIWATTTEKKYRDAISYKVLMGDSSLKYEPDFAQRADGVRLLSPATTYHWSASWGSTFRLTVREGGPTGPVIYDRSQSTPGNYSPSPHTAFLGANDVAQESGSYAGAIYRNFWVGSQARPASLGTALAKR